MKIVAKTRITSSAMMFDELSGLEKFNELSGLEFDKIPSLQSLIALSKSSCRIKILES